MSWIKRQPGIYLKFGNGLKLCLNDSFLTTFKLWQYNNSTKQIIHGSSEKCLAIDDTKSNLLMEECGKNKANQKWNLQNFDPLKA